MPPRLLPTFDPDSIRKIAEHVRRLEMQIGNLERRLAGRQWQLDDVSPFKQFCRFTTTAAFTTSSSSVAGTIQTQWGPGADHPSTAATFKNLLSNTAGTYVFEGASGAAGWAVYSGSGTDWYIWQMQCP